MEAVPDVFSALAYVRAFQGSYFLETNDGGKCSVKERDAHHLEVTLPIVGNKFHGRRDRSYLSNRTAALSQDETEFPDLDADNADSYE